MGRSSVTSRYRLVPNGSHSRLEKANDAGTPLQLSSSGGFKLFSDSKFDAAMVAFLDCLQQFKTHVESQVRTRCGCGCGCTRSTGREMEAGCGVFIQHVAPRPRCVPPCLCAARTSLSHASRFLLTSSTAMQCNPSIYGPRSLAPD